MRNRLILLAGCLTLSFAGYYITSPLLTAHKLRKAIKIGDSAAIQAMIVWPSFRASVRRTIAANAKLIPFAESVARRTSPTWWQRVRSLFGHSMVDRFVERYITPQGLPTLYRAKNRWYERSKRSKQAERKTGIRGNIYAGIVPATIVATWRRIRRAEFRSPFHFVLEMEDRHKPSRLIESTFKLISFDFGGLDWKLTEVAVRQIDPEKSHLARLNGFGSQ